MKFTFEKDNGFRIFIKQVLPGILVCIGLYIVLAILWKSLISPFTIVSVFIGFMFAVGWLGIRMKDMTTKLVIEDEFITVHTKKQTLSFKTKETQLRLFRIKNRSTGIRLMDDNKVAAIWKNGFTNKDWVAIKGLLQSRKEFESELYDYSGLNWDKRDAK
jgi:hypothetical protein